MLLRVKVIDRVLYKLDDLVRPYVHKILVCVRNPKPETGNSKPATRNKKSGISKPETQNKKSRNPNPETLTLCVPARSW